ncbi:MAG: carbohydrate binding domain-containing protein [Elusimicrobiota bacterium]
MAKKWLLAGMVCLGLCLVLSNGVFSAEKKKEKKKKIPKVFMVTDFNIDERLNNLEGGFGAWNKDEDDPAQFCVESFNDQVRVGNKGYSIQLDYSVDSPRDAYNGFWMKLLGFDATPYKAIAFQLKGDKEKGYTTKFKIELKNPQQKQNGRFYVTGVTDDWQDIVVPFESFRGIKDFSYLSEFVVVFEDRMATKKKGRIYIDDVRFLK